uniref:Choline-specific glycerophosphodiester phosphodiesterase n=1 Tax=Macrostomum lignano TaxID=282301 RepID=A0A1I8H347_9PLAT
MVFCSAGFEMQSIGLAALALLCAAACASAASPARYPLVLVSCDGFRYDYLNWYPNETQFLRSLIKQGVHVKSMKPAFATKTFPNHWTIATGLYQESHGIVGNSMYDPLFNASFNKGTRDERWWNASEPIWINAKKQGLKSATFFWPGSEVSFKGVRQDYWFNYSGSVSFETRVSTVLEWITEKDVQMATMYLNEPDSSGHKFGPKSKQVREALKKVDDTIRSLFEGLKAKKFSNKVNVLIVSDHGMMGMTPDKVIHLDSSMDELVDRVLDSGPLLAMNAKPGKRKQLVEYLNNQVRQRNLSMRVFDKDSLPERFHYAKNRRTPEVLVLPDQGYLVLTSKDTKPVSAGHHGFDNSYSDMRVPMFAVGPSFHHNFLIDGNRRKSFRQVDIYGLMCHLLQIRPQPNNGSTDYLPFILKMSSLGSDFSWFTHVGLMFFEKVMNMVTEFFSKF